MLIYIEIFEEGLIGENVLWIR